jgi:aspartyl-tRNA(Asn)/glutamyl-tRNA(Gln) amidotransferase subunit C
MPLERAQVEHIAHLARLKLSPDEIEKLTLEMAVMIDYFEQLQLVDTDGVEPRDQFVTAENVFRQDTVGPSLTREQALSNAPESDGEFFLVPKVLG